MSPVLIEEESLNEAKKRTAKIMRRLRKAYGEVGCALHFSNPLELLVAVILSAQCTDKRVNLVTPALFKKYKTAQDYAKARPETLEQDIRSTGFYKSKARYIIGAAKVLVEKHSGNIPTKLDELVKLPGVGRKTANAVLGHAFGVPGLTVDTHMIRVNQRLGLTRNRDPVKIEQDLMRLVPRKDWTVYSDLIINHGRVRCFARKPDCPNCPVDDLCPVGLVAKCDKKIMKLPSLHVSKHRDFS